MKIPVIDPIATGNKINELRQDADLSVKEIQDAFGFERPQAVYHWIHGRNVPTIDNIVILAELLNTTVDELLIKA